MSQNAFPSSRRVFLGRILLGAFALAGGLMARSGRPLAANTLETARSEGRIRVGFANEVPFGYADASGELTGEAPEVLRAVMRRLGIGELEGVLTEFASLIPGLQAGRFDMIAAGMYVTPARCEQILFSQPTYSISEQLAVAPGNPKRLATYAEVAADPDVNVAIMVGSASIKKLEAAGVQDRQIAKFPDLPSAVAALGSERVDAVVGTALSFGELFRDAEASRRVEVLAPFTEVKGQSVVGHGAFGFRKEDTDLRDAVDAELARFIGSPEHLELVAPFGFSKYTLPVMTTEEMCRGA